jgi:maltose alpha-D-glucosyltransferase/alpha-amylase
MVRSFDYAARIALRGQGRAVLRAEDLPRVEPWANAWSAWASAIFVRSYLATVEHAHLLPSDPARLKVLFDAFVLSKALYELSYELNNRPDWIDVPLQGVRALVEPEPSS